MILRCCNVIIYLQNAEKYVQFKWEKTLTMTSLYIYKNIQKWKLFKYCNYKASCNSAL